MATTATAPNSTIAGRVTELHAAAVRDPAGTQELMWEWLKQLGADRDTASLEQLFEAGLPPGELDGPADGMLVTTVVNPVIDLPIKLLTNLWMPWRGKVFDAAQQSGLNRLTPGSTLPAKLLWPLYSTRATADGPAAFQFVSGPEPGKIKPRVPVLKIDYEPVSSNPNLIIRQIRDELVEFVPDTYLGRILLRLPALPGERFANLGYFALRQPATANAGVSA